MKKYKTLDILTVIIAVVLSAGIMTAFSGCALKDDGTWMKCHDIQLNIFYIGIAITVLSLAYMFIKSKPIKIIINITVIALAVLQALLPVKIMNMCAFYFMRCYTIMKPFSIIMGVILVLLSILKTVSILRKNK